MSPGPDIGMPSTGFDGGFEPAPFTPSAPLAPAAPVAPSAPSANWDTPAPSAPSAPSAHWDTMAPIAGGPAPSYGGPVPGLPPGWMNGLGQGGGVPSIETGMGPYPGTIDPWSTPGPGFGTQWDPGAFGTFVTDPSNGTQAAPFHPSYLPPGFEFGSDTRQEYERIQGGGLYESGWGEDQGDVIDSSYRWDRDGDPNDQSDVIDSSYRWDRDGNPNDIRGVALSSSGVGQAVAHSAGGVIGQDSVTGAPAHGGYTGNPSSDPYGIASMFPGSRPPRDIRVTDADFLDTALAAGPGYDPEKVVNRAGTIQGIASDVATGNVREVVAGRVQDAVGVPSPGVAPDAVVEGAKLHLRNTAAIRSATQRSLRREAPRPGSQEALERDGRVKEGYKDTKRGRNSVSIALDGTMHEFPFPAEMKDDSRYIVYTVDEPDKYGLGSPGKGTYIRMTTVDKDGNDVQSIYRLGVWESWWGLSKTPQLDKVDK